jgi:hypothetical protein
MRSGRRRRVHKGHADVEAVLVLEGRGPARARWPIAIRAKPSDRNTAAEERQVDRGKGARAARVGRVREGDAIDGRVVMRLEQERATPIRTR